MPENCEKILKIWATGNELDALVAKEVMGWVRLIDCDPPPPEDLLFREEIWINPANGLLACAHFGKPFPRYSTDIAAAWKVVEKMRALGFYYAVGSICGLQMGIQASDGHHAAFGQYGDTFKVHAGDSIPHAICLAALEIPLDTFKKS